jgi:hypothetical protein
MSRRYIYFGSFASATWFSDDFGMPMAAYSLRKLTPTSTNCVRVRRSSDNTEQDIGFASNTPYATIDTSALLSFVGAGNGFVVTWYNQNTSNQNATQSTAANQPQIVSSGSLININSLPSIKFDGSNDSLNAATLNVSNIAQTSVESVLKLNSTAASILITISEQTAGQIYLQWTNVGTFRNFYRDNRFDTTPTTNQAILSFYSDGTNARFYQNTSQLVSYSAGSALAGANGISIGRYSAGTLFANSNFQEVIIWNSNKQSDRAAIQTNLNDFYNVF